MNDYVPPLRDIEFVLDEIVDIDSILSYPDYAHVDRDTIAGALAEAGRFMSDLIAPTNRVGDEVGSVWEDGAVVTPDEFKKAWQAYVEAGWNAVSGPPEYGGHGFPKPVGFAVQEMLVTANMALSLNPMLTGSAITLLVDHGSEEQKATYLENLITAEWSGTMVLTEPEAGSDLGALRAKAEPSDDGTWKLSGTKIFITWGDHDLSDNIIHLVLARVPDAPPGTKGISLFIVPKFLVGEHGNPAERNAVTCVSVEHKLGIHGSPTCVLGFEEATAYLVGEPNQGMRYMFTMMNQARVDVGLEGLGVAERSFQQAAVYAAERKQGRAIGAPKTEASPIVEHPDVRRMLMTMKANTEAMRSLLYDTIAAVDRSHHDPDEHARARAAERASLLTPVAKAWCTDLGVELTSIGLQVHGGMGYVEETGSAQHFRDARITPIYEGTNGIQAIDLAMRKLPTDGGAVVRGYLAEMDAFAQTLAGDDRLEPLVAGFTDAVSALGEATEWLLAREDPNDVLAAASPYLRMFGTVVGGYHLARQARRAVAALGNGGDPWFGAKIETASFYVTQILPQVHGLLPAVTAGAGPLFAVSPEQLGATS
jgi:alkylation response protein AidB-like acyl-CoA dehydrogenase